MGECLVENERAAEDINEFPDLPAIARKPRRKLDGGESEGRIGMVHQS